MASERSMSTNAEALQEHNEGLPTAGWNRPVNAPTLPEAFRTVRVPKTGSVWRKLLAFIGPGNWATDISGGAVYNYALLSVILLANFTAIFLQALAAKLGIVTGRDLAQACRDAYHPWVG
jgi:manganese transport protein